MHIHMYTFVYSYLYLLGFKLTIFPFLKIIPKKISQIFMFTVTELGIIVEF